MAALGDDDIEKLFSGAPQYFARSESHFHGAPHPSVAFPFDEELEIRDLTDHGCIEDRAWSGVTAWPHIARDVEQDAAARRQAEDKHRAHFYVRCRERPNMLSMRGLEKGTMGYQAALELSTGDSLEEEQFGFESVGTKARAIVDARERILGHHGWLRRVAEPDLLDRLRRNAELYRDNDLGARASADTHADLFGSLMRPCSTVIDKTDHCSLSNQVVALLKCLGSANVWIDFSRVEWRIRLGQVLWGEKDGDDVDDATAMHDADSSAERAEEKYWLFMQLVVASELLLRLDAITDGVEFGSGGIKPIDVAYFERGATQTVKWSLVLARSWLENIDVVREEQGPAAAEGGSRARPPPRRGSSWLASLVSKMSSRQQRQPPSTPYHYTFRGRQSQRQVDGLIHFAKELMWPGIDRYEARISRSAQSAGEAPPPPPPGRGRSAGGPDDAGGSSPSSSSSSSSANLGAWDVTCHRGKPKGRAQTQRRRLAAALHESGWLTRSYVFGFMLPGEGLCHFLMATLLENDCEAMARLGPFANLSGGFVYADKSFWSTSCIVGRVLAAGKGAAECMGWISTDVVPEGRGDGWLGIEVDDVADDVARLGNKARLWAKKRIERESSILGDGREGLVLPADFIIPHETSSAPAPAMGVELLGLELTSPAEQVQATPLTELIATTTTRSSAMEHLKAPELLSYPARLRFSVLVEGGGGEEVTLALAYDICFVTAHPCAPSHRVRMLKSPSSPTVQTIDVSGAAKLHGSRSVYKTGHPLHKFYKYRVIHLSELVQKPRTTLSEFLLDPMQGRAAGGGGASPVLVVDCATGAAGSGPQSPGLERAASSPSPSPEREGGVSRAAAAAAHLSLESQRRQFGSDVEVLVRAACAQRGWNAIISRRRRGCLACAIREAGALGWKVIVRVD